MLDQLDLESLPQVVGFRGQQEIARDREFVDGSLPIGPVDFGKRVSHGNAQHETRRPLADRRSTLNILGQRGGVGARLAGWRSGRGIDVLFRLPGRLELFKSVIYLIDSDDGLSRPMPTLS